MVDIDVHSEEYILGQNIRKYRLKKGWSQKTLSDVVDIDRADISKYENGVKGEMGFKTLKKFAIALGVSADDLLIGEKISVELPEELWAKFLKLTPEEQTTIRNIINYYLSQQRSV